MFVNKKSGNIYIIVLIIGVISISALLMFTVSNLMKDKNKNGNNNKNVETEQFDPLKNEEEINGETTTNTELPPVVEPPVNENTAVAEVLNNFNRPFINNNNRPNNRPNPVNPNPGNQNPGTQNPVTPPPVTPPPVEPEKPKPLVKPTIQITKSGTIEKEKSSNFIASVSGDYKANTIYVAIGDSNGVKPSSGWYSYANGTNLQIGNLGFGGKMDGDKYVWISVIGKDNITYYNVSNKYTLVKDWDMPNFNDIKRTIAKSETSPGVYTTSHKISFSLSAFIPEINKIQWKSLNTTDKSSYVDLIGYSANKLRFDRLYIKICDGLLSQEEKDKLTLTIKFKVIYKDGTFVEKAVQF